MAKSKTNGARIVGLCTCVPQNKFDNLQDTSEFSPEEVRKVVAMAGVSSRRTADESTCSSDLCLEAAKRLLADLSWERDSVDALIMVTQTPDYFLPSTACIIQKELKLSEQCAAFDVGLGCSGYTYGLWLAGMMLENKGVKRILLLHGETPTRFVDKSDRSVFLLFGDAGSATALEASGADGHAPDWSFLHYTDGSGYKDLIIEGGGFRNRFCEDPRKNYVFMNGANVFNFTLKRVPPLILDTLTYAGFEKDEVDYYVLHQSNRFIIQNLMKKLKLPTEKVPLILKEFGNTGGPSIPLTMTQGELIRPADRPLWLMLISYGVGLSWGSALVQLGPEAVMAHVELS